MINGFDEDVNSEEDNYEEDSDREPRRPIKPYLNGGAAIQLPEEESEEFEEERSLICA